MPLMANKVVEYVNAQDSRIIAAQDEDGAWHALCLTTSGHIHQFKWTEEQFAFDSKGAEREGPHTIETTDEFAALADGSVVVDGEGIAWQRLGGQFRTGSMSNVITAYEFPKHRKVPTLVLWEGGADE